MKNVSETLAGRIAILELPGNNVALPWQDFPAWLESNMN
jgi:hypothetical protein